MPFQASAPPAAPQAPPAATPSPASAPAAGTAAPQAATGVLPINQEITPADMQALRARRDALSTQLGSVSGRRKAVLEELKGTPAGEARRGLEERLRVMDERIIQIEKDIAENGRLIASAPAHSVESSSGDMEIMGAQVDVTAISIVFTLFVLFPIAFTTSRAIWKRTNAAASGKSKTDEELLQRMTRLENAVDTIAVEIERVSEGQRFVSKVLAERPAIGGGAAEPVRVAQGERAELRRG